MEQRLEAWYSEVQNAFEEDLPYIFLDLSDLNLTSLPILPEEVRALNCNNNNLTSIEYLPSNLNMLLASNNSLVSIKSFPDSLRLITIRENSLTALPELPSMLASLECSNNYLYALPALPSLLTDLECSYNQLTSLPNLPPELNVLHCDHNQLTQIPTLPSNLQVLRCNNNLITRLPKIPPSVVNLYAFNNPLRVAPNLNNNSFLNLELPDILPPTSNDNRNFNDWNFDVERTQTCFDDINQDDFDVVEFLTQDPRRQNIILSINGVFKCYNRETLRVFLERQGVDDEGQYYINSMTYDDTDYFRLYTREWVTRDGLELILNPMYSIYDIQIDTRYPMDINDNTEYAYSVAAYTVDAYVQA